MLNGFKIVALPVAATAYKNVDGIALFLCKECAAALGKLCLPEQVQAAVEAYADKHEDMFAIGTISELVIPQGEGLLTVVVAGCGVGAECKPVAFRKAAGEAARALHQAKVTQAVVAAPILTNAKRGAYLEAVVEGLYLGAYTFTEFKSEAKAAPECTVTLCSAIPEAEALVAKAQVSAEAVCFTRDLVNRPGNVVNPEVMANAASKLAEELPLEVEVLDEVQMAERKMGAILAVGQGSANPPRMITLKYNGADAAPYVAYVGKGITFDSGGISIKPDDGMGEMKDDMSGAGAVLGAMKAIATLGLKCNVIGILACAENMPGGRAQRPGDIVRAANGKTIEVISTDAEGRMVLADAVDYACKLGAQKVIDIATLTGAVIIALGKETSGIVSNDDALVEQIKKAGKFAGENYWQLPSLPECKEAIKSDVADLLNSAGRPGGCITGGLFIGEFVAKGIPWAHLDIGGTSTATKDSGHKVKGGTGFGTLTLIKLAEML
ncbi:leucyl aminopeptidase [Phascolarctobacterium sp.]|uniref:leucyl aminopeptidase n=1 Tax=Phascolarctobacterium sp. TaxID=2049039 RepID=UPI002A83878A|nr:leucyl aminopeptidase [Phascolarctobacterium sp.]MDY5045703.1 leucyl aminopeptidase [Phascolarctobacterium sp.]